ncbi:methyltransferase domain-containing protein [Paenibacillus sp. H1-7]|uniref:methyltransferase domain-containing protein n=1 Tax=Paenibacillus sp. H1-7 TaxID=2282849 RepID=UPI001EF789C9|nr:methyltransferase domain-containing protein [Paenibacillus sp. H1-7]
MEDKSKRLSVYLPEKAKTELEQMAADTGLSMTQLVVMATHGLLANYKTAGNAIFSELVSPRQQAYPLADNAKAVRATASTLENYYGARAHEYERIYYRDDPNYQQELTILAASLKEQSRDRNVLEIACGTGYWTAIISETADHIVGVDIRPEVIEIAREKGMPKDKVRFIVWDAYQIEEIEGSFDLGIANFWFSHIPKNKIEDFLTGLHNKLTAGSRVFMADNVYVEGRGGQLIRRDHSEDTYKLRELSDGSQHEVLKNYYSYEELRDIFEPVSEDLNIFMGQSFWYVSYTVK